MSSFPEYKRDIKYTSELAGNKAYMLLGLPLGSQNKNEPYIIGAIFAEEMYFFREMGYEILLKINCPGGVMMDGFSIMDAVLQCDADTEAVGVVASMALPILLCGKKRRAYDYAKAMIHPPQGGNKTSIEMMRDSLAGILKSKTKYSDSEITDMLKEGAGDTWLTAADMERNGVIDKGGIITTNKQLQDNEANEPYALFNVYNQLIEKDMAEKNKPTESGMDPAVSQAFADIKAHMDTINDQKAEIERLKNELQAEKDTQATRVKNEAALKVEAAIKAGQLAVPEGNTALKDQYVKMAIDTPEAFAAILESRKETKTPERKSVTSHMKVNNEAPQEETYEWLANHDPKKLYDMMDNDPDKYNKIVAAYHDKVTNQKSA